MHLTKPIQAGLATALLLALTATAAPLPPLTQYTFIPLDDILIPIPVPFTPPGVAYYGDFNGDGRADVLVLGLTPGDASYLFFADAQGQYTRIDKQWSSNYLGLNWSAATANLYVGDYNADGRADLIYETLEAGGRNALIFTNASADFDTLADVWDTPSATAPSYSGPYNTSPVAATTVGATAGSFAVAASGGASYSIPLATPPGPAGLAPSLSITYNSQGGDGPLGFGWGLAGLSVVHRCPMTVAQDGAPGTVNYDANDRLCLDGQRLVAIGPLDGGTEYRTEIESHTRVVGYGPLFQPTSLKAWTKQGQVLYYGNTADSRIEAQGLSAARVWAVSKIQDLKGNALDFSYGEDSSSGEYWLNAISYNNGRNRVDLSYATRADPSVAYMGGAKIASSKLLQKITTTASVAGVDPLWREYRLFYEQGSATKRTRLKSLQECGSANCLAATVLAWQDPVAGLSVVGSTSTSYSDGSGWNNDHRFFSMDINGDGKTDVVTRDAAGTFTTQLSNGTGFVSAGTTSTSYSDANGWNSGQRFFPMDFNGDGKSDLILRDAASGRFIPVLFTTTGWVSQSPSVATGYTDSAGWNEHYFPMDANGDGLEDLVLRSSTGRLDTLLSNGTTFTTAASLDTVNKG